MNKANHLISTLLCLAICASADSFALEQQSPCDSIYAAMMKLTGIKKPSIKQVRSCIDLAAQLYPNKCHNYEIDESSKIAQMIISSHDSRSVASYFEYLRLTHNSADEARSLELDRMLNYYPETVLKTISTSPDPSGNYYPYMLAWGFANNYYEDHDKSHEALSTYYYKKHPGVKPYAKKYAPVLKQVFENIEEIDRFDKEHRRRQAESEKAEAWRTLPLPVKFAEPSKLARYVAHQLPNRGSLEQIPSPSINTLAATPFHGDSVSSHSSLLKILDAKLQTAWLAPPTMPDSFTAFTVTFRRIPRYAISGFAIATGCQENDSTWHAYSRPRIIQVSVNSQPAFYLQLADTTEYQFVHFDAIPLATDSSNTMTFTILDEYKDNPKSSVAISELRFICIDSR